MNACGLITSITPHGSSTPIPYTCTLQEEQVRVGNGSITYEHDVIGAALQADSSGTTSLTETTEVELLAEGISTGNYQGTFY